MATNVTFNGNVYSIPAVGEDDWGQGLTDYFIAIANGALQKSGGNFSLTADVNFGATFGLLSRYFSSRSGAATAGLLRLSNLDVVSWRNFAANGNLDLGVDSSDRLVFNGGVLTTNGITQLTGDVTAVGPGSVAATIANNAVSNAKLAQIAMSTFKGRTTAGTGNVEDLTSTQATALLNAFVGDSGSGGLKGLVPAPITGDALKFLRGDATWASVPSAGITDLTGDVTATGPGSSVATIANNVVSNAKLAQVATATFKGRTTAGTGNVEDLTATQATALLNNFVGDSGSGGTKGLVPAPAAGDAAAVKFLRADGTWATTPAGSPTVPTVQRLTSGAGTYTRPTGPTPLYLRIRMCGGGGGGGPSGTGSATDANDGGQTLFGSSLLSADGGQGAQFAMNSAPAGGSASVSSPAIEVVVVSGGFGGSASDNGNTVVSLVRVGSGTGGSNPFGGSGGGGFGAVNGAGGVTGTGAGGGGGGTPTTNNGEITGAGGGAGGYLEAIIPSPSATYSYTIGNGGSGGFAGITGQDGGNGGDGIIIVEEFYQ